MNSTGSQAVAAVVSSGNATVVADAAVVAVLQPVLQQW
jgi:hypothetical protein